MIGNDSDVQSIVFSSDTLGDKLWETVAQQIKILTKSGYDVEIYEDEVDIVVIRFAYKDPEWAHYTLEWLDEDELSIIEEYRDREYSIEEKCKCYGECSYENEESSDAFNDVYNDGSTQTHLLC